MKFVIDDKPGLDELETENSTTPARTSSGRFPKSNKEGNRFPKGVAGKPKGAKNRKTLLAQEFANDVLYLNPDTGRQMTYHELCIWIKKKADSSPRILNLLLDHALGKLPEHVQQEQVVFIINSKKDTEAQDAHVIDGNQKYLPRSAAEKKKGRSRFDPCPLKLFFLMKWLLITIVLISVPVHNLNPQWVCHQIHP